MTSYFHAKFLYIFLTTYCISACLHGAQQAYELPSISQDLQSEEMTPISEGILYAGNINVPSSEPSSLTIATQPKDVLIKFYSTDIPRKEIASTKVMGKEYFTQKSFLHLMRQSIANQAPLIIARVEARRTFSSKPSTPSIEEGEEAELVEIARTAKKYPQDRWKDLAEKDKGEFEATRYKTIYEFYEASHFNQYRYESYPLTPQKIVNPVESKDPKNRQYAVKGVEYYLFDPQTNSFDYQFSDVSLVGGNNLLYLTWLNAHQTVDPFTRAVTSAELGNMYAQGRFTLKKEPQLAQRYLTYAYTQDDTQYAKALAAYYFGLQKYTEFYSKPANGKQKILGEALAYFQEAYDEQSVSAHAKDLAKKAAYYLGQLYLEKSKKEKDIARANKHRKMAEEYFEEALDAPEFRQLALDELAELRTTKSCCGFLNILKKKNKIAPE